MFKQGLWYALGAYGLWGFLPIYWKLLSKLPALQILCHRMIWSLVAIVLLLSLRPAQGQKRWQWLKTALANPKVLRIYALAALLLALNWALYIWAVNANFVIETSLGYFINPLMSVFLGVVLYKERLRPGQWLAIVLATLGVIYLTFSYGRLPWIALGLASSFAIYGVLKKQAPLEAGKGLFLETATIFLPALSLILYWQFTGVGAIGRHNLGTDLLLLASGIPTSLPLLFFAAAAKRLPLSMMGIMQYIAPSIQFLLGIFVFKEYFDASRLMGFCIIWLALIVFTSENLLYRRKQAHLLAV
ncbi:MAG: EamA family transporter RarD [Deinococcales bacterium]